VFRERVDAFQAELARFLDERALKRQRLTVASFDARPRFRFREPDDGASASLLALAAWAALAMVLAARRLPRVASLDARGP